MWNKMPAYSLIDLLNERAETQRDCPAYAFLAGADNADRLTFFQLRQRARAIAARLQALGASGERALLLYPPGIEYICAFYGCVLAGTTAVPAYPPRNNRNLERIEVILEDSRPKVVLTTESVYNQIRRGFDTAPHLSLLEWVVTSEIDAAEAEVWVAPRVTAESLCFLQYTSASTSRPKGVMVSHGNILHNQALQKEAVSHNAETVMVSWLPLFHDMGLISVVLSSLYNGVPCYLMSPVDFLKKPIIWLEAITRYRGTFSGAPDFGYHLCVDRITPAERENLDLSSWRVAFNGSEPVRAETLHRFADAFAPCGFRREALYPCYGLAENTLLAAGRFYTGARAFSRASLEAHHPRPSVDEQCAQLVSCGAPLLDERLVIADPQTMRRCVGGEIGEIWLDSPSVAKGYWNKPAETEASFQARLDDGDGPFLRTGDLGFVHDGEMYVTGRLKDLIIIRGRNLIPQDIEQTVERADPAIRPAFVAAVSVEVGDEEKLVVVSEVRREVRREMDSSALAGRIRGAVAAEFGVDVSAIALLKPGALPKTSSGKTQRAKVKRDFLAGELEALFVWRDEPAFEQSKPAAAPSSGWGPERLENWLVERIAAGVKTSPARIDRTVSVLTYGLDSVHAMALLAEIEDKFGIALDPDRFFDDDPTVLRLARRILGTFDSAPVRAAQAAPQPDPRKKPAPAVASVSSSPAPSLPQAPHNGTNGHHAPAPAEWPKLNRVASNPPPLAAVPRTEHPFRKCVNPELGRALAQMALDKSFVRGEGSWLWDESGRRYLDFLAQYGALPFGFNPPRIWAALNAIQRSGEPSFVQPSYLNAAGELAQRLLAIAPRGMAYVTFSNSGAEAVEAAIKLCRSTTGRHKILSTTGGFHGKTLGALSATAKPKYQQPFGAPAPGFDYVPYGDIDALRQALGSGSYAGFLVEPIQGEGGIVEPPSGYLRMARKSCREAGTLFVADEIQTGLGRTGAMFACGELGITPDVMTVAKALGGGLVPIGACICTAAAYNEDFALKHTSTFAGNTLACRVGLATLDMLEENDRALIASVAANGSRLKEELLDLQRRFPTLISEVRGRGYLLGLRFGLDRNSVQDGLLGYLGEQEMFAAMVVSHLLHVEGVRLGYTLNQGGILRIEPPLTASWDECQFLLSALERMLLRLERRDLASFTAQVTGLDRLETEFEVEAPRVARAPAPGPVRRRVEPRRGDGRFAFLVHPLAWKDYADIDSTLSVLSENQLAKLSTAMADNFDPFVVGETRITAQNGKSAYGEFILVPRRAEELRAMPYEKALDEIRQAVLLGKQRGAEIVGLGAYTSVVTQGGLALRGAGMPPLTTGNSYTAVASRETVRLAAAKRGWSLERRAVAVIGAGGAVGQALSVLLARDAGRLVLLGNPDHPEESRQRLLQVAGRIVCLVDRLGRDSPFPPGSVAGRVAELGFTPPPNPTRTNLIRLGEELVSRTGSVLISVDSAATLPDVDIVVCCTNTTERIVRENCLRENCVVCDVSRPSNVADDVHRRPDVIVLEGGVIRLPGDSVLGFNASLGAGRGYACMAETMMLAIDHRYRDMSLGFELPLEPVLEMERLAAELGFEVVYDQRGKRSGKNEDRKVPGKLTVVAGAAGAQS